MKVCGDCKAELSENEFHKKSSRKDGLANKCKICSSLQQKAYRTKNSEKVREQERSYYAANRERKLERMKTYKAANPAKFQEYRKQYRTSYKTANPDKVRGSHLKHRYGLSIDDFNAMREAQDFKCYCCGIHEDDTARKTLCVDHNHKTGAVRKLLCSTCNIGIGLVKENQNLLRSMADYLELDEHK